MPRVPRTLPLLLLIAVACATAPTVPPVTRTWLARFTPALRYVPAGMQSHWLSDHRALPTPAGEAAVSHVEVHAGRNFQPATDVGVGAYEGVSVEDHAPQGVPPARRGDLGTAQGAIAGNPVWLRRDERTGPGGLPAAHEHWAALVCERFVVTASSEALLRQALLGPGLTDFGRLEPLPELPPNTVDLVLRDLAGVTLPATKGLVMNVPGASAIAAVVASPYRIQVWSRDESDLRALAEYCFSDASFSAHGLADPVAKRHAREFRPRVALDDDAASFLSLECLVFFGAWVFI